MGNSSINGGCSIAMFDYWRVFKEQRELDPYLGFPRWLFWMVFPNFDGFPLDDPGDWDDFPKVELFRDDMPNCLLNLCSFFARHLVAKGTSMYMILETGNGAISMYFYRL